jgi:hypothetical protein
MKVLFTLPFLSINFIVTLGQEGCPNGAYTKLNGKLVQLFSKRLSRRRILHILTTHIYLEATHNGQSYRLYPNRPNISRTATQLS